MGWPLAAAMVAAGLFSLVAGAAARGVPLALVVYFFRDPPRRMPQEPGLVVSPADGTVAEVTRLERDEFIGGPAVRIGIFLSIFNVHLNRAPLACRVVALRYSPGEFLNALRPESAVRNENMWIGLEEESPPHRRLAVRQISGAIARRIVCDLRPGEVLAAGAKVRHDQARLADRVDPARRGGAVGRRGGWPPRPGRQQRAGAIYASSEVASMRPIRTIAMFPTMLTLGNLVCGFFAIVVASRIVAPTNAGGLATSTRPTRRTAGV